MAGRIMMFALAAGLAAGVSSGAEKKFVAFGWEFRNLTADQILAHADRFKGLPIDGVGILVKAKNPKGGMFSQIALSDYPAWDWKAFESQVPVLKAIVSKPNLSESFLGGYRAPMRRAAWTDDKAWACIENNLSIVARLAHLSGIKGISIDHEDYRRQRQFYLNENDPPYDECCRLARARGRQLFGAVFREHPSAIILSFWVLSEYRPYFATRDPAALMREKGDLWPSFIAGIVDAMPPTARLVEGDEHGYRHESSFNEFHVAYANAKRLGSKLLPEDVRGKYLARVEQGFGQYMDYYTGKLTPGKREKWSIGPEGGSRLEHFRRNIQAASDVAEEYIWLWGQDHPWIEWDESAHSNQAVDYSKTWERMLPGVSEMLATVKGGEKAEIARLDRLLAAGALTNLIANAKIREWQVTKDAKGRPVKGEFNRKPGGVYECKGMAEGCFYAYCTGARPGARYAIDMEMRGRNAEAAVTWCDMEGALYRLPTPQILFGRPREGGWRRGVAFLTVPLDATHFKVNFGAARQKPGESVEYRNCAAYLFW